MSERDLMLKSLAADCAPRIAGLVEKAVVETVRQHLPSVVEAVLRENFAGRAFSVYVRKDPQQKRMRNDAIRAAYNGHNCKQLAAQFGLSMRQVFKIATGKI